MKLLMLSLVALLVASCATLNEDECRTANWTQIGQEDGSRGYTQDRLGSHSKACSEFGITPNTQQYNSGYAIGNKTYCAAQGTANGEAGKENQAPRSCSTSTIYKTNFKTGYKTFCYNQGVAGGNAANKKHGRVNCLNTSRYRAGFNEGIKSYCTDANGEALGTTASDHKAIYCPRSLKSVFMTGYERGTAKYCERLNGFNIGKQKGTIKPNVCPSTLRSSFEQAFHKGIEYNSITSQIAGIDKKVGELNAKLNAPDISPDLKAYITKEVQTELGKKEVLKVQLIKIEGFVGI